MNQLLSLLLLLATTAWRISAAMDLKIVNAQIAPDGFKRSSVLHLLYADSADIFANNRRTVLAGGTFPGPLITGSKVVVISKNGRRIF